MPLSQVVTPRENPAVLTGVARPEPIGWSLAARLCAHLTQAGANPCLWKLDAKAGRFESGEGDLDLLVARDRLPALGAALEPFGFRAGWPRGPSTPAILDFFAPNPNVGRLIHLHVHTSLFIGSADGMQYRIPMERAVLDAAELRDGLRVACPAHAVLLHVLHRTLRHGLRAVVHQREAPWIRAEETALEALESRTDGAAVHAALRAHVPLLDTALYDACRASLRSGTGELTRLFTALRLRWRLRALQREPLLATLRRIAVRIGRRHYDALRLRPASRGTARPASGGAVIALVGPDGDGKTTCAHALRGWLGDAFVVHHLHLGRPPRGVLTLGCGALAKITARLRAGRARGPLAAVDDLVRLARILCTARDRERAAHRAHGIAARGGIAICERYPIDANDPLSGASDAQGVGVVAPSRLATALRRAERRCYQRMLPADLTLVLRTDPETAVRRKHDEPADYVRERAERLWNRGWQGPSIRTIDASRPLPAVLGELRDRIWERL